jgi:hypothetical protein
MKGATQFSQLDLMLGSGDTSLGWKFGSASFVKKCFALVNYSAVLRGNIRRCIWCVFLCTTLRVVFFMYLDVFDAVHLSSRQKTAWCVDNDEISRRTSPKPTR